VARLAQDMAISLLELNTFAHCISAFFIYIFWWHKPYDVQTHVYINNVELYQQYLLHNAVSGVARVLAKGHYILSHPEVHRRDEHGSWVYVTRFNGENPASVLKPWLELRKGETIPGTGFMFSISGSDISGSTYFLSEASLAYWQRLWTVSSHSSERSEMLKAMSKKPVTHVRSGNMNVEAFEDALSFKLGLHTPLIMIGAFLAYGAIHLLAWQNNFQSTAESVIWKMASITAASSVLIVLISIGLEIWSRFRYGFPSGLRYLNNLILIVSAIARAFLFVESFKALPNSPESVYDVPTWAAYLPHI